MTHTLTVNRPCESGRAAADLLPAHPYYAPRYHFGMLLGVDDFETEQAYHRGKQRAHNGWLHREGVVWGLRVSAPEQEAGRLRGEIQVDPGLALDAAGNTIHLESPACLHVAAWYNEHRDDPELDLEVEGDEVRFHAHVVARFRACFTRPVPALVEPCEGAATETAYSRAFETAELLLRPGPAPDPPTRPYHRLRLLFHIDEPRLEAGHPLAADQEVLDERAAILAQPPERQPMAYLEAFRRFAALDALDLEPEGAGAGSPTLHFPAPDRPPVVLADATVWLRRGGEHGWTLLDAAIDNTIRPSHVATRTIQELLCGPACSGGVRVPPGEVPSTPDAGGPRADPASVSWRGERVTFDVSRPLLVASVDSRAVSVTVFDRSDGWTDVDVKDVTYDATKRRVTVALRHAPRGLYLRVIARGTGPFPLLGRNGVPLAGPLGGPPGTAMDGHDFVWQAKIRS